MQHGKEQGATAMALRTFASCQPETRMAAAAAPRGREEDRALSSRFSGIRPFHALEEQERVSAAPSGRLASVIKATHIGHQLCAKHCSEHSTCNSYFPQEPYYNPYFTDGENEAQSAE